MRFGDQVSAATENTGEIGPAGAQATEINGVSALLSVLRALLSPEGEEALPGALKAVLPFDRALLVGRDGEGAVTCLATEPAVEIKPFCDHVPLNALLDVRVVPSGETKESIGLAGALSPEDCALILPLGLRGKTAVAVLVRAKTVFNEGELTLARVCSAASLASIVASGTGKPAPNNVSLEENGQSIHDSRLLKVILDHLPISLTVQDSSGRFILANAMAAADLAVSTEKLLGSSPADFLSEQEASARRDWEQSVINGGKTISTEAKVTDLEGDRILLSAHTPVFITNNTLLISSSVDITEHREVERRLTERAHIDKLTGLPDRVRIEEYVTSIINSDRRPFALAFIDLDNFKHVNDYYSHAIGDALLIKIGERIRAKLRPGDMLARISGDEFLLLFSGFEDKETVSPLIEQVLTEVKRPFYIEGFEIFTSCSIGVSFYPTHGESYEKLRRNADGAMYGAKGQAKGQAKYFDDGLGKQIAARMEAEQRLRLAIRDRRFVCAFQPKVDIHSREVVGFETLVRWRDSDGEIHPPGQFISLAIELGLINPITNFVLTETLSSIDRLDAAFGAGSSISINVGAKQTGDLAFMRSLIETIKESGRGRAFDPGTHRRCDHRKGRVPGGDSAVPAQYRRAHFN